MQDMNNQYEKWNRLSPLGLLLIGLGVSLTGHAAIRKGKGKGWLLRGTLGLIFLNSGVAVFGEAVKARTLYEVMMQRQIEANTR